VGAIHPFNRPSNVYRYSEDGILRGHLDKPWGLDQLSYAPYNISGSVSLSLVSRRGFLITLQDISKSSARAWLAGGFNYNNSMALQEIQGSLVSNGTQTPFQDGAGWTGTFTLPVCDMGYFDWNTQYGDKTSRYGLLPCCCGSTDGVDAYPLSDSS
jgi:hypothetical protein